MTGHASVQRRMAEGALAGLRFMRNRIGDEADLGEFIEAGPRYTIGKTFGRAAEFLKLAAANAPAITGTSVHSGR